MIAPCALCKAISNEGEHPEAKRPENTVLLQSNAFLVLPALGPFTPGHVLVVSKEHIPNLASMGATGISEYLQVCEKLSQVLSSESVCALEAEHGATKAQKAGACVVHTHIHWLPGLGRHERFLDGWLKKLGEGSELEGLTKFRDQPYIFVRGQSQMWIAYDATGVNSQMIRRTLCDELDRDDLDWRSNPRPDWVRRTISLFGSAKI
ncbi:hypothetical protein B7486_08015 [cyanobacterium TDX16]|nr:hypothetical protein B7486_08015 [cyanobacterium TDX16]